MANSATDLDDRESQLNNYCQGIIDMLSDEVPDVHQFLQSQQLM